jgi:hypothetical protein
MAQTKKTTEEQSARTIKIPARAIELQKRVLSGQKTLFDTTYNAVTAVQESQEKALDNLLGNVSFLPEEARDLATAWSTTRRQASESYKEAIHKSFDLYEHWIDGLAENRA